MFEKNWLIVVRKARNFNEIFNFGFDLKWNGQLIYDLAKCKRCYYLVLDSSAI